ncbi:FAD-binding oxidoreductase [Alicycliphilus sp. T452]|jgi:FAD/FMN-containing dehydrogenase
MDLIGELRQLVGGSGVLDAAELATRPAGAFRPEHLQARALVRPASTREVSDVLRWCHAHGIPVVAQGGLTGLVRGADAAPGELILSLERMRAIESIDPRQRTATVQAGVTLQALQEAVDAQGLAYPLDLGARGSATLGGTAATNAGGNRVIRYGMTRDMVLGLEAVLADGTVVSSMHPLIKNNTGYDLKQLFIGSEGTLGVITRLVLRLREKPTASHAALVGLESFGHVAGFLRHMDRALGGSLSAFEVMWQSFYRLVTSPPAQGVPPIGQDHPFYVLVESQGSHRERDGQRFETAMEAAFEDGLIADAAIAQSEADVHAFWRLRDDVGQVVHGGYPVTFDISLPIAEMEGFTRRIAEALPREIGDGHRLFIFGHLGDGNLHVVVQVPMARCDALKPRVEALVYGGVGAVGGSVSAEHGIGLDKRRWLALSRSPAELALMCAVKAALDPKGILNPGKLFEAA